MTSPTVTHPIEALRQMVADDINRHGTMSSFMIRNGKLADLLDELHRHRTAHSGEGVLHVAGNGQALKVSDVKQLVARIEADAVEAYPDTVRMLEFLVHVIEHSPEGRSNGAGEDLAPLRDIVARIRELAALSNEGEGK